MNIKIMKKMKWNKLIEMETIYYLLFYNSLKLEELERTMDRKFHNVNFRNKEEITVYIHNFSHYLEP